MNETSSAGQGEIKRPIDFITFLLSLASSVQIHLGLIPNPATGEPEKDILLAKQTIDIMGIIQEKTKGNLDAKETKTLEDLLYNLRMAYVQVENGGKV